MAAAGELGGPALLDAVQELRDAGAEVIEVNDLKKHDVNAYTYTHNDGSQTELQASYASVLREKVDANNIDLAPSIGLSYWSFRLMIGLGMASMGLGALALWLTRSDRLISRPVLGKAALATMWLPFIACSFGWIFREMGRQPWVVFGEMATHTAVSPSVGTADVWTSMIVFTLLYGGLAVVEVRLLLATIRKGAEPFEQPRIVEDDAPLEFAY
mgnify:CR=1 FL=1